MPTPIDAMTNFDESYYYRIYNDVATAYGNSNGGGLEHFLRHGIEEKRSPNCFFHPNYYAAIHGDLSQFTGEQLLDHWQRHGVAEGRRGCPDFHLLWYRDAYEDLRRVFANNLPGAFEHYIAYGSVEGRQSAPGRHLKVFPSSLTQIQISVNVYKIATAPLWHSGIVIDGIEYFFDSNNEVGQCSPQGFGLPHHRTIVRNVPGDSARVKRVFQTVVSEFHGSRYDLTKRNCNVFVNEALVAIGTEGLDDEYLDASYLANIGRNVPGGATLQEILVKWPIENKRLDGAIREDFRRLGHLPRDIVIEAGGAIRDIRDRIGGAFGL